jgi:hypothetical protein
MSFLPFLISCIFCIFGIFNAKIHEFFYVCIMFVHLTFEGEKHILISSFLLIIESYIKREFLFMFFLYHICFDEFCCNDPDGQIN